MIPKQSAYDTKFTPRTADGSGVYEFRVPQGTNMIVSLTGLHYNSKFIVASNRYDVEPLPLRVLAKYWDDPSEFRPERFLGDWDKYAWVPFSSGPRACLGRRYVFTCCISTLHSRRTSLIRLTYSNERQRLSDKRAMPMISLPSARLPAEGS